MNKPEKLPRQTPDARALNMEALRQLLPECFAEVRDPKTGAVSHALDWDALRQALGDNAAEGRDEMYQFTWPGKNDARREAAQPTTQTLRPLPQEGESRDWATTQNVYIEGDNLQVLKLLQRGYMGRVKMIYIDPPYNTGNDFVYHDDFRRTAAEEDLAAGNTDEQGNRFRKNLGTNGRFHSDWCSMIYARLLACRSLLTEDGVIFISIDDNEVANLKKICDEVFGEGNFVAAINWKRSGGRQDSKYYAVIHEYILCYAKTIDNFEAGEEIKKGEVFPKYDEKKKRYYKTQLLRKWGSNSLRENRPNLYYPIEGPDNCEVYPIIYNDSASAAPLDCKIQGRWRWGASTMAKAHEEGRIEFQKNKYGEWVAYERIYAPLEGEEKTRKYTTWIDDVANGTDTIKKLFGKAVFDYSKSTELVARFFQMAKLDEGDIILDFFSGSATTAHAVMQLNAEDGGHRKYICVQLPEETAEDSEARKAGYQNICEIGKERIRRAGAKIREASPLTTQGLDTGFRVFRLAESNFENVSRQPKDYAQDELDLFADNIRQGRTDMDLLFGAMLMMGVPEPLSQPVETLAADGKQIYDVAGGALVACFAEGVSEATVAAIAARRPLRVLFRDSCFKTDAEKINIFEQFKQAMDWTDAEAVKKIQVL